MNFEDIIKKYRIGKDSRVVFKNDPKTYYVLNIAGDRKSLFVYDGVNKIPPKNKQIANLVKVDGKEVIKENACNCGCGGCAKAPILNEQLVARQGLSEGMLWHIDNKKPLTENLYRAGSNKYFELWKEARTLYSRDLLEVKGDDLDILMETDLGHIAEYNGQLVPLDFPIELTEEELLAEAKKVKKKNPPLNKPKRGGSKKFYVYVRKPGGGIKKVSFGDTSGLSAKINNPEARRAFAKRHDCANKKDKTKASYWSCRLPRYAKLLGLKSNFSGFW
jgi:hypothetical protein